MANYGAGAFRLIAPAPKLIGARHEGREGGEQSQLGGTERRGVEEAPRAEVAQEEVERLLGIRAGSACERLADAGRRRVPGPRLLGAVGRDDQHRSGRVMRDPA